MVNKMAIPPNEIPDILSWLVKERQNYDYWPKGFPVNRNNTPIMDGWNNVSFSNPSYQDPIRRSQFLLKTICNRMSNAITSAEKADSILLIRFWDTHRRAKRFADYYNNRISDLVNIWDTAKQIANHDRNLIDLNVDEIGIAVASSLVTAISPNRNFGILNEVVGSVWKKNGWINFDVRPPKQGRYLQPTPFNWNHYTEYINDLTELCNSANKGGLTFVDPLTGDQDVLTPHDVEMAFYKHYHV